MPKKIKNEQNDQNYLNGDDSAIRERRGVDRLKVLLFLWNGGLKRNDLDRNMNFRPPITSRPPWEGLEESWEVSATASDCCT